MTSGVWNIIIEQGANYIQPITYADCNGVPINITGWTFEFTVRRTAYSDEVLAYASSADLNITTTPLLGKILINVDAAVTQVIDAGDAVYDLKAFDSYDIPQFLLNGVATIRASVTR